MSLKLYLVRHGQTIYSQKHQYCGDLDPDLIPEGVQMAQQLAVAYKDLPWKAAFVSPMKRTMATAKPLVEAVGLEPQIREGLKEIAYGEWEGKSPEIVNRDYHDDYVRWLTDPGWNAPTEGETGVTIARRSSTVIQEIQERYTEGNVLVVSHKATIRVIICHLLGIDVGRFRDRIAMPVCSVSTVEFCSSGPLLLKLADQCHLHTA